MIIKTSLNISSFRFSYTKSWTKMSQEIISIASPEEIRNKIANKHSNNPCKYHSRQYFTMTKPKREYKKLLTWNKKS